MKNVVIDEERFQRIINPPKQSFIDSQSKILTITSIFVLTLTGLVLFYTIESIGLKHLFTCIKDFCLTDSLPRNIMMYTALGIGVAIGVGASIFGGYLISELKCNRLRNNHLKIYPNGTLRITYMSPKEYAALIKSNC